MLLGWKCEWLEHSNPEKENDLLCQKYLFKLGLGLDAYFLLETTLTLQALYCRRQNIDMQLAAPITNPIKAAHINDG